MGLLGHDAAPEWNRPGDGLTIRESRRAKRLILQLIPPHTLELVVPKGTRPKRVEDFVREHRHWIEQARYELSRIAPGQRSERPTRIELKALGREWAVRYRTNGAARAGWRASDGLLTVTVRDRDATDGPRVLRNWLLEQARCHLKPWLHREAVRCGIMPRKVQVRLQKTRWGSCSANRNISLNAALLFVEPAVVRYLFVHELSHLRVLNHSPRFWHCVERFESDYRVLDERLGESWTEIPYWVLSKR